MVLAKPVQGGQGGRAGSRPRARGSLSASAVIFLFWLAISASVAPPDLAIGAVLSLLLGWGSARFLWAGQGPRISPARLRTLSRYVLWLGGQVILSAVHVARLVIDPRMPISPRLIVRRTGLRRQASRMAFAHSVTLTPGTLTVDVTDATFVIHCLDAQSAAAILSGELERRIAEAFESVQEDA
jgi:multicomponent Na+:H+ antiporter subunit E